MISPILKRYTKHVNWLTLHTLVLQASVPGNFVQHCLRAKEVTIIQCDSDEVIRIISTTAMAIKRCGLERAPNSTCRVDDHGTYFARYSGRCEGRNNCSIADKGKESTNGHCALPHYNLVYIKYNCIRSGKYLPLPYSPATNIMTRL